MLKRKAGFTLVETIITMGIFAIASIILLTGFTTVTRYLSEANEIKKTNEFVYMNLEKDINLGTPLSVKARIDIEGDASIDEVINFYASSKSINDSSEAYVVKMYKYNRVSGWVDPTLTYYESLVKCYEEWILLTENQRLKNFNEAKAELNAKGFNINYEYINGISNGNFRWYYYVVAAKGEGYPEIDKKILDVANEIFDALNPLYPKHQSRVGDSTYYMKPYLIRGGKILLMAEKDGNTPLTWDGWRSKIIYNPDDFTWYYKVFKATKNTETSDSYIVMADFTTDGLVKWEQLKQEFSDASKWSKIIVSK